jgi:hypothetical protein
MSPADLMEYRIEIEDGNLPAGAVPQQKTPNHLNGFQAHNNSPEMPRMRPRIPGTLPRAMNWLA